MTRATALILPLLAMACAGPMRRAFDSHVAAALQKPTPDADAWIPDAMLFLSDAVVARALAAGLVDQDLSARLDGGDGLVIRPDLSIRDLAIRPATAGCDGCLGVTGTLTGQVGAGPTGLESTAPLEVGLDLDLELLVTPGTEGWLVRARPHAVHRVDVAPGRLRGHLRRADLAPITPWLEQAVVGELPVFTLARFGRLDLPLEGVRLDVIEGGVEVRGRTESPEAGRIRPALHVDAGWTGHVSSQSVVGLARAALFAAGPVDRDLWIEPLDMDLDGERFRLEVRMWVPRGVGWWRTHEVMGSWSLARGRVHLEAEEVFPLEASPGAGEVDLLPAMGQGRVLDAVANALNTAIPIARAQDIQGVRTIWSLTGLVQQGEDLVVEGSVDFENLRR